MKKNKEESVRTITPISWFPGHMTKARREIQEKLHLIDIVYEVIDARMPISSRIPDIDNIIGSKPKVLIVSKYDMCDKKRTDKLLEEFKNTHYIVKVNLLKQNSTKEILNISKDLLKEVNEKRMKKGLKQRPVRALVVGVPNVGKSTLINNLVGKKAAKAANKPGVTKGLTWIRINKELELLDTPGILWPKFDNHNQAMTLASLTSIKDDIVEKGELAIFILKKLNDSYKDTLYKRYELSPIDFDDIEPTLIQISKRFGATLKQGEYNYERVYSIIIKDLKDGNLGQVTFD